MQRCSNKTLRRIQKRRSRTKRKTRGKYWEAKRTAIDRSQFSDTYNQGSTPLIKRDGPKKFEKVMKRFFPTAEAGI